MDLKKDFASFINNIHYFAIGFIGAIALLIFLINTLGNSLTSYFESVLGIPYNIHHDLIGLLGLLGLWLFRKKFEDSERWALAGFFLGLIVQAFYFSGPQFITFF